MQQIKIKAYALALLGNPFTPKDLADIILDGLNDKSIIEAVNGCDTTISFSEHHEKLLNRELALSDLTKAPQQSILITANHAQNRPTKWRNNNNSNSGNHNRHNGTGQRYYHPY